MALTAFESIILTFAVCGGVHLLVLLTNILNDDSSNNALEENETTIAIISNLTKIRFLNERNLLTKTSMYYH